VSKAVWKFEFAVQDEIAIDMPAGAIALTVALQFGSPCLWALVDPAAPLVRRRFRLAGTGHPPGPEVGNYVGSFQLSGGHLVFHLFEREE